MTAPLTEYASRRGTLISSMNAVNLAGLMRDSSSSGKVVENLGMLATNARGLS